MSDNAVQARIDKRLKQKAKDKEAEEAKDKLEFKGEKMDLPLLAWQQAVAEWAGTETHDREIVWIYDLVGGCGKDFMTKWLVWHKGAGFVRYGSTKHCLNVVANNPKDLWVVNLTRTKPQDYDSNEVYATIESIKDGFFFVPHYEGKMVMQKIPKVVVFANFAPDQSMLSKDRWNIVQLSEKDKAALPPAKPMFQFNLGGAAAPVPVPQPSSSSSQAVTQLMRQQMSQPMAEEEKCHCGMAKGHPQECDYTAPAYCYCGQIYGHKEECYKEEDFDELCDNCGRMVPYGKGCVCHLYEGGGCIHCGRLACSGDDCAD